MTDEAASPAALCRRYRDIHRERMRGLPFLNPALEVEALEFRPLAGHRVGVLVAPWLMNLVLLPGDGSWDDRAAGDAVDVELPGGRYEFLVNRDGILGTYLAAALFGTVTDVPDQATARAIAADVMDRLFSDAGKSGIGQPTARRISRRELISGLRAG